MSGSGFLVSAPFWLAFLGFAILDRAAAQVLPRRALHTWTIAFSAAFLLSFTQVGPGALAGLFASLCVLYAAAVRTVPPREDGLASGFGLLLGAVGLVWSLGKIGASLDIGRLSWLFVLGGSFLLIKVWTFLKDLRDGRLKDPELSLFLSYCFYFPCFVSGPMHHYSEFRSALEERLPLDGTSFVQNGFRILHGLVKVLLVAVILRPFSLVVLEDAGLSNVDPLALIGRAVAYSFVLYLDFSGYSDIVIGAGGLAGVRVPENFRLPYLAPNIREFWQRWHITFTRVLTQYLFVPLTRTLQAQGAFSARATATVGYLVTFLFCGFWHGSTLNFLAWGLFHGVGLAFYDAYRNQRMRRARELRQPLRPPTGAVRVLVTLATFLFVSVGWILFVLPLDFLTR